MDVSEFTKWADRAVAASYSLLRECDGSRGCAGPRGILGYRGSMVPSIDHGRGGSRAGAAVALGSGVALVVVALASGCSRPQETVEPAATSEPDCNPADDCNDLYSGSTIRQHSEQAGTFAELSTGCPHAPDEVPPLESLDDRSIPQFDASRDRGSNMHRGEDRLQDIDLHAHMMGIHDQMFACVDLAACYEDGAALPGDGELEFDFELHPDGHVVAVSVQASPGLDHPSVVACARQTVGRYRFPQYDGGQMMVNYRMTIEEVPGA